MQLFRHIFNSCQSREYAVQMAVTDNQADRNVIRPQKQPYNEMGRSHFVQSNVTAYSGMFVIQSCSR